MKGKGEYDLPFGRKFEEALAAAGWTWGDYVELCRKNSGPKQLKEVEEEDQRRKRGRW